MSVPSTRVEVLGLPAWKAARLRSDERLGAALAALPARVSSARVVFSDQNAAKGGLDIRCGITVSVRGRGRVHVQDQAATPRRALDGALAKLERRLVRVEQLSRDSRRRPKKYFAAARLLGKSP